jgi:hypothetical protein
VTQTPGTGQPLDASFHAVATEGSGRKRQLGDWSWPAFALEGMRELDTDFFVC